MGPDMTWGLGSFFQTKKVPPEKQWKFTDPAVKVDSTEARNALKALWGDDFDKLNADPKQKSAEELAQEEGTVDRIIKSEEEVQELLDRMSRSIKDSLKKAKGGQIKLALR